MDIPRIINNIDTIFPSNSCECLCKWYNGIWANLAKSRCPETSSWSMIWPSFLQLSGRKLTGHIQNLKYQTFNDPSLPSSLRLFVLCSPQISKGNRICDSFLKISEQSFYAMLYYYTGQIRSEMECCCHIWACDIHSYLPVQMCLLVICLWWIVFHFTTLFSPLKPCKSFVTLPLFPWRMLKRATSIRYTNTNPFI